MQVRQSAHKNMSLNETHEHSNKKGGINQANKKSRRNYNFFVSFSLFCLLYFTNSQQCGECVSVVVKETVKKV